MIRQWMMALLLVLNLAVSFDLPANTTESSPVTIELIQEDEAILAGRPFWVAIRLDMENGWHVYWKNPGDAGIPVSIDWDLPAGFSVTSLLWPFPEKFNMGGMVGYGYEAEVVLLAQITPPSTATQDNSLLKANVEWLVCSESTCLPGSGSLALSLKWSDGQPSKNQNTTSLFEKAREKIPCVPKAMKAIRKNGLLQLEFPQTEGCSGDCISQVMFFPESKNVVNSAKSPTIQKDNANKYLIDLEGTAEIGAETKTLKGVLVLHKQSEGKNSTEAFDIDSLIEDEASNQGEIGFLESKAPEISSVSAAIVQTSSAHSFDGGLMLAILFAFLGGMILNLMPCVLPVLSFKVMSFVKMAGQSRSLTLKHGLFFSLGVLLSFWVLASVMLILRAYGETVGWGFQLQEPGFVIVLATLLFLFALNLFGVFEFGLHVASWAGQAESDHAASSSTFTGSFLSGVLATAVATPCSGPFLGSAIGFAVTVPVWQSLLIFTFLALGMCFPYLILAGFPKLLRFMPKPGPWMETFKQLMGFFMLATVLWLAWVFGAQTDTFSLMCLLVGLFLFSIGAWIYGKVTIGRISRFKRIVLYAGVLIFAALAIRVIAIPQSSRVSSEALIAEAGSPWKGWEAFSPDLVERLRNEGKPILVDFTAKWCLICQTNHMALASEQVEKHLADSGTVKLVADWTKKDPVIAAELSKFGRNSVPLYVYYEPGKEPRILPQVLTPEIVLSHIKEDQSGEEIALK